MKERVRSIGLQLAWWAGLYRAPDRILLEDVILPRYTDSNQFRRVLFVGVRWYTRKYPAGFDQTLVTLDSNPRMRRFGAMQHITNRLQRLQEHVRPESLDAVIINGVIGWGLNRPNDVEDAVDACYACMRAGAELVLGFNESLATTPPLEDVAALGAFVPFAFPTLGHRYVVKTPMAEKTHTYLFYRKP